MTDPLRLPARVEVDLAALRHNASILRRATPPGAELGILVKAHAYGHGREMAARAALAGGADRLIVATLDEGFALRAAGITEPILVVYPIAPDAVGDAVQADLQLSVGSLEGTRRLLDAWTGRQAALASQEVQVHVEIDTGMGRGGVPAPDVEAVVALIAADARTELAGLWSHLSDGADRATSAEQARRFDEAVASLASTGHRVPMRHLVATEGLFAETAPAYDMVRIGLAFYGELGLAVTPAPAKADAASELRQAMSVKARPVRLERIAAGASVGYGSEWTAERESLIATLPIGYADGWTRHSWPGGSALVRGRRVPLVGRVSMDSVCADVTDVGGVTVDNEFVLLGRQGDERITAADLARLRGTIPNEVFCAFGARLPRVYLDGAAVVATSRQDERVDRATASR